MNRFVLAIATAAFSSAILIGGAQAGTIWRYPFKGAPYAVPHDHSKPRAAKIAVKPAKRDAHR